MPNSCCFACSICEGNTIESASSWIPRGSAALSTHRLNSSQNAKAHCKSSIGCTQHGNFWEVTFENSAGSPRYSKKWRTTIPMQARGNMKVGRTANVCKWSSFLGEEHMNSFGSNDARCKSHKSTDASDASTNCRRARFKILTKEWNAAKSKSTSAFHMSFFNFMGTSEVTRQRNNIAPVSGVASGGYPTFAGNGFSGCAGWNGSLLRTSKLSISNATKQGSTKCLGQSFNASPRTVMLPSPEMYPRFSKTIRCTNAAKEFKSWDVVGYPGSVTPLSNWLLSW
mmetsp:Transcript_81087/g.235212  ORF Transcript_81087/g.235212 Transcript_81087/m.235212 type:complete len:283 (-) Transcript_81087:1413-2261(-)